ncbi:protoporphyrinogen oxidase HemJ [Aurantivibrio plasticivorans]
MLWVKTFHIFFVVAWFACIFYLPRLFVNYAIAEDEATRKQLLIMQQKLLKFSIPWVILSIVFGAWLMSYNLPYYGKAGWLHAKLLLVLVLIMYHGLCASIIRQLSQGRKPKSHIYYRWFNEFPVLILLGVLILVEVQPF